jgi:hypothetical protein
LKRRKAKARISSNFDLSLSYQFPAALFEEIASATLGVHGTRLNSEKRAFKVGGQLEFNV